MKTCSKCKQEKDELEFYRMGDGRRPSCKTCDRAYQGTWQRRNPDKARKYNSKWHRENWLEIQKRKRFSRYGITELGPRCEVCGSESRLCADHDHTTGKFRGTLCNKCNSVLGLANDSIDTLLKLIEYLRDK